MRRLLALLVAVGLVVGAVALRQAIDDPGGGAAGGGAGGAGAVRVVCATDLADACEALADDPDVEAEVRVEDPATTAEALVDGSGLDGSGAAVDAWLVASPWPGIVEDRAGGDGPLGEPSDVLARSPVATVGRVDRLDALRGACGGQLSWRCTGERAGSPWEELGGSPGWGELEPGHRRPDTSDGLLALGAAAASWFGTTGFASNDFAEPGFDAWFQRLEGAVPDFDPPAGSPLAQLLIAPPSYGVVAALEAEAGPAVARSRDRAQLALEYPAPMLTADVVLVPVGAGRPAGELLGALGEERVRGALAATGWRVAGEPLADGLVADLELPDPEQAVRPGVLDALRARWQEAVR